MKLVSLARLRPAVVGGALVAAILLVVGAVPVAAQTQITVSGAGRLIPIAIQKVCDRTATASASDKVAEIGQAIERNLTLSGFFQVLDRNSFIESPPKCAGASDFAYSDWSVIGSEGLVRGLATVQGQQLTVQLFLHDVVKQQVVLAKEYVGTVDQARRMAHRFSNEIMKFFTGQPGIFGTQIAYSSRIGRFKELMIMDLDGSNVRQLTSERGLALSPSWNRDGTQIVYTAYRNRMPDLFRIDPVTRAITQISRGPALEIGGRFFPAGGYLVSRSMGDDSDLVVLGEDGTMLRRLSPPNGALDVSPVLSPDGRQLLFVSNRAGGPQVYLQDLEGGGPPRRVSFATSNYCTSPAWSPRGDQIAFVCRADAGFQMFIARPDGREQLQLTGGRDNEDPDFSPDGRYLVFATTQFTPGTFALAMMKTDGTGLRQLTTPRGGDFEPSWSPILP